MTFILNDKVVLRAEVYGLSPSSSYNFNLKIVKKTPSIDIACFFPKTVIFVASLSLFLSSWIFQKNSFKTDAQLNKTLF